MYVQSYLLIMYFFFFNDTATTEIYTLSLHDALPILVAACQWCRYAGTPVAHHSPRGPFPGWHDQLYWVVERLDRRSEEHTSELQSRQYLVCRLLLEKKKKK